MTVSAIWKSALAFEGKASHLSILISPNSTDQLDAMSPEELLLLSLASSSGMEVMKCFLETKEQLDSFEVSANGKFIKKNGTLLFNHIDLVFCFKGKCQSIFAVNAVEHSQFISCGISAILCRLLTIRWVINFNGEEIADGIANYDYSLNGDPSSLADH